MKSRITIEVDFENLNNPVIQIDKRQSDDVRDKLISHFTQHIGGSSWCLIKWKQQDTIEGSAIIHIAPIPPQQLKEQAEVMLKQHQLNLEQFGDNFSNTGVLNFTGQ